MLVSVVTTNCSNNTTNIVCFVLIWVIATKSNLCQRLVLTKEYKIPGHTQSADVFDKHKAGKTQVIMNQDNGLC